jgi:transcriptional regulator with XRE-family HTH domain
MDINLLNYTELARRIDVSAAYIHQLMTMKRKSEKRLQQIARELGMSVGELKRQIVRNRHKHAGNHAPAHSRTHGNRKG